MTELDELAEELGTSGRTLRRAASLGTLRARSTQVPARLTMREREYVRRSWGLLSKLRAALRTETNVRAAVLFGSASRGEDDLERSDVDILVDMRDPSLDRVIDLSDKLAAALQRPVDVIRLDDAKEDPSFLANAVEEGRVLADRDRSFARLQAHLPSLRAQGLELDERRARSALEELDRTFEPRSPS